MRKIMKGDQVVVIAGKERGKTGKISQVLPEREEVVVDGLNKMYKHVRPQKSGEKGQRIEFFGPIAISNVKVVCPKCKKASRIGAKMENKEKKRVCKKCNEVID